MDGSDEVTVFNFARAGINFINIFMQIFFTQKTKSCLFFKNKFHHAFLYKNCAGCAIHKSHLAVLLVLVVICKSQLAKHEKALKKQHKNMKLTFGERTQDLFALNFSYSSLTGVLFELDTSLSNTHDLQFCSWAWPFVQQTGHSLWQLDWAKKDYWSQIKVLSFMSIGDQTSLKDENMYGVICTPSSNQFWKFKQM